MLQRCERSLLFPCKHKLLIVFHVTLTDLSRNVSAGLMPAVQPFCRFSIYSLSRAFVLSLPAPCLRVMTFAAVVTVSSVWIRRHSVKCLVSVTEFWFTSRQSNEAQVPGFYVGFIMSHMEGYRVCAGRKWRRTVVTDLIMKRENYVFRKGLTSRMR